MREYLLFLMVHWDFGWNLLRPLIDHALVGLHTWLNMFLFGKYSDLAWSATRALTAICCFTAAWIVRRSPDRFLLWAVTALGCWLGVKVLDDFTSSGSQNLTPYFMGSNVLNCLVMIGISRSAIRERVAGLQSQNLQLGGLR